MHIVALIFALVAVVCFIVAAVGPTLERPRNFVAWGLAALTVAWICQLVLTTGSVVKLN